MKSEGIGGEKEGDFTDNFLKCKHLVLFFFFAGIPGDFDLTTR